MESTADTCHFCEAPAVAVCEWNTGLYTYHQAELGDVIEGDKIRRYLDTSKGQRHAKVLQITEKPGGIGYRTLLLQCTRNSGQTFQRIYGGNSFERVAIYRPGKCETPVCEAHHRDHGAIVCRNHWKDLEVKL